MFEGEICGNSSSHKVKHIIHETGALANLDENITL